MQPDKDMPANNKWPADDRERKTVQAQTQSDTEPFDSGSGSPADLRQAAEDLKTKIAEARQAVTICRWTRRWEIQPGNGARPMATSTFLTRMTTDRWAERLHLGRRMRRWL